MLPEGRNKQLPAVVALTAAAGCRHRIVGVGTAICAVGRLGGAIFKIVVLLATLDSDTVLTTAAFVAETAGFFVAAALLGCIAFADSLAFAAIEAVVSAIACFGGEGLIDVTFADVRAAFGATGLASPVETAGTFLDIAAAVFTAAGVSVVDAIDCRLAGTSPSVLVIATGSSQHFISCNLLSTPQPQLFKWV